MMYEICDELDMPYEKSGTTVFATDESAKRKSFRSWKALPETTWKPGS